MSREEAGRRTFLRGALDLLVLRVLARGPQHGFGITKMLSELSRDWLQIEEGSLYPCLYRLEERGWVKSSVSSSENNRRARYYELTRKGSEELRRELLGHARKRLGAVIAPKEIEFVSSLPKNRAGKIMRRLLKARELGLSEGDTSTLESSG